MLNKRAVFFYVCAGLLLCISSYQQLSVLLSVLLFSVWILTGSVKASLKAAFSDKIILVFMSYYVLHFISLLYSTNYAYALFDLQVKLPLLFFPFFLLAFKFDEKEENKLRRVFILGASITSVICLIFAAIHYFNSKDVNSFFYKDLSRYLHPTYFAIYLNLAFLLTFDQLYGKREEEKKWRRFLAAALWLNSSVIILLMSRTSLAIFAMTFLAIVVVYKKQNEIFAGEIRWMVGLFVFISLLFSLSLLGYNRFTQVVQAIEAPKSTSTEIHQEEENSTVTRISLWKNSIRLIGEHPLIGVGIGDIKDELVKMYEKDHFEFGVKNRFNPHSQYLHTTVSLGVIGLSLLLLMLVVPFFLSIKNGDWIYAGFLFIIIMNSITESILERQAGILFFAFFNTFFYLRMKERVNDSKLTNQATQAL